MLQKVLAVAGLFFHKRKIPYDACRFKKVRKQ